MNQLKITEVRTSDLAIRGGNILTIKYVCNEQIKEFFNAPYEFNAEYSVPINGLPNSIAVIPFICNILPIIWLTDCELLIPELDSDFFKSIDEFKKGYINMYPMLKFKGRIIVDSLIDNKETKEFTKSLAFFSGGVDAFATLIAHESEKPSLITVWGADIALDDYEGWEIVKNHAITTGRDFNVCTISVKSNFRDFLNVFNLNKLIAPSHENYWHGFQHGIGIIGLSAPIVWKNNIGKIYFASSYSPDTKVKVTCASDPSIDNYVRIAGCVTVHDQYEFSRIEKIDHICEFVRNTHIPINLRVCWITRGGHNCCKCEKCIRTMLEIFMTGEDPCNYGFNYTMKNLRQSKNIVIQGLSASTRSFYEELQIRAKNPEFQFDTLPNSIKWIKNVNLDKAHKSFSYKVYTLKSKLKSIPLRALRKFKRLLHYIPK